MDAQLQFIQQFIADGFYESAYFKLQEMLTESHHHFQDSWQIHLLLADCLVAMDREASAMGYYLQALKFVKLNQKLDENIIIKIKERVAKNALKIHDYEAIVSSLKDIPEPKQTTFHWNLLAQGYQGLKENKLASTMYIKILRRTPNYTEIALKLVRMGVSWKQLSELISKTDISQSVFIEASLKFKNGDHQGSLQLCQEYRSSFPKNVNVLLLSAKNHMYLGDYTQALDMFEKIRKIDPFMIEGKDLYAKCCIEVGNPTTLKALANELFQSNPKNQVKPEPWLILALYSESKQQYNKALYFALKAVHFDSSHVFGYLTKGSIYCKLSKLDRAAEAFKKAFSISPDIMTYSGLIFCYLQGEKNLEALTISKSALQAMPNNPIALYLVGQSLRKIPDVQEKGKLALQKALKSIPTYFPCLAALVEIHLLDENPNEALSLLEHPDHICQSIDYFVFKANVLTKLENFDAAFSAYSQALKLDPECVAVKQGLKKLERIIQGEDDGLEEEADVQGEEDEEDDQDFDYTEEQEEDEDDFMEEEGDDPFNA